jgi:hypothetical protein
METRNEELRTLREFVREPTACLDLLEQGDIEKLIITQRGKIRAVILTPSTFDKYETAYKKVKIEP